MTAGRTNVNAFSTDWNTPLPYVQAVRLTFGGVIGLDPCSNDHSVVGAVVEYKLPMDGLHACWDMPSVYVNPPYGRDPERRTTIADWLRRCAECAGKGSDVIALVPVATNTGHWKSWVFPKASRVCFLSEPRVKFTIHGLATKGAPMACAMVYWGAQPDAFAAAFRPHGHVLPVNL